jgi:hypothetical protein
MDEYKYDQKQLDTIAEKLTYVGGRIFYFEHELETLKEKLDDCLRAVNRLRLIDEEDV